LEDEATVVLEQNRVAAATRRARAAGVQLGMRRSSAQMLLPQAQFQQRDSLREQETLKTAALALLQYSPLVTEAEQASLLAEVGASLRLFGGVRALLRRVRQTMRVLGLSASIACAPTARGAWLLAQHASRKRRVRRRCLSAESMISLLDRLPVQLLPAAAPWLEWLQGIDCTALAELRQLPRAGLQRRCGKEMLQTLDCAYGEETELFGWIEAPPSFQARVELPDRMEHAEAIQAFACILLAQLAGWLTARQLAVSQISLQLEHERGRLAIPPTPLLVNLADAVWREEHMARLLKEHLAHLVLQAPVIAVRLDASRVEAMAAPSASLFPEPGGNAEDHKRLIELLVARLGADNVLQPTLQADHRPEVANHWATVLRKPPPMPSMPLSAGLPRPAWLLPQPLALGMREHRPYYRSPLKLLTTAERIEAGWWDKQTAVRDYFIAEGADHVHYWIYRENVRHPDGEDPAWFLHGVFG
jgi:protein ImuB